MSAQRPVATPRVPSARRFARLTCLLVLTASPALAAEGSSWRIARGEVRVACPMTVGGSFEAKTAAIEGTLTLNGPGAALGGQISVDLKTLDTGIGLRNEHLQGTYLEVGKGPGFDHAVLAEIRLGSGDPHGIQGKTPFSGVFAVHGMKQAISGQATIRREGSSVRVEAAFPVAVSRFGIAKPQYLGVGVRDEVNVQVTLVAEPAASPEVSR